MQTQPNTDNQYALKQLDKAISTTKQAAHACNNPQAQEHLEYALALITECWIAEDGQQARPPATIVNEVKNALNIFDALEAFARKEGK